jgi:hypothetical protein
MVSRLGSLIEGLKACVAALDPGGLSGEVAMELHAGFTELERLGAAGRLLTGERVASSEVWRRGGFRSAADWLARAGGTAPERAREALETAGSLSERRVVAAELRAGRLSEVQAHVIVDAASVCPETEAGLVEFARAHSLRQLREECRRVKNSADSAAGEYEKVHRSRSFRSWTGRDGAFCFSGRVTTDAGAALVAAVEERKARHLEAARAAGRREPFEAYAADALVELVTEDRGAGAQGTRPKTMMVVHVSYDAMVRGHLAGGEVSEIAGVGPIPLDVARRLAADSILRVLVAKGGQPMAVTPGVRTVPRALRLLIEARDRACVVPGCDVTRGLQVDHRKGWAVLGPTDLENCALLCKIHHDMKSYLGYVLRREEDGSMTFSPPDDYLDPEPTDPTVGTLVGCDPWSGRRPDGSDGSGGSGGSGGSHGVDDAVAAERQWKRDLVGAATSGPAP